MGTSIQSVTITIGSFLTQLDQVNQSQLAKAGETETQGYELVYHVAQNMRN
jgi:hypothetical protein